MGQRGAERGEKSCPRLLRAATSDCGLLFFWSWLSSAMQPGFRRQKRGRTKLLATMDKYCSSTEPSNSCLAAANCIACSHAIPVGTRWSLRTRLTDAAFDGMVRNTCSPYCWISLEGLHGWSYSLTQSIQILIFMAARRCPMHFLCLILPSHVGFRNQHQRLLSFSLRQIFPIDGGNTSWNTNRCKLLLTSKDTTSMRKVRVVEHLIRRFQERIRNGTTNTRNKQHPRGGLTTADHWSESPLTRSPNSAPAAALQY